MSFLTFHRIDCVGILKLRNADIELRNGETDIGRKNTRVRLVFRVHIPQPGGHFQSLQVASDAIECCKECLILDKLNFASCHWLKFYLYLFILLIYICISVLQIYAGIYPYLYLYIRKLNALSNYLKVWIYPKC